MKNLLCHLVVAFEYCIFSKDYSAIVATLSWLKFSLFSLIVVDLERILCVTIIIALGGNIMFVEFHFAGIV